MKFRLAGHPDFATEDPQQVFQTYYATVSSGPNMLASWDAPWREMVMEAVGKVGPIGSLYEVGCGAGPNLKRLTQAYPHLRLGGCDFAESMVALAVEYGEVTVQTAPCKVGAEWDAALTCYALAYLDPHQVAATLQQIESRHLILAEPTGPGGFCEFVVPLDGALPCWVHDYPWLLARTGWHLRWTRELPDRTDLLNRILIAERGA